MSPRRPNILILMPDELRADALGYAGHPVYRTPHVDRLAREGVAFANAYCTSPLCMPARASMISGLYPHNHHIQENAGSLPLDDESYAHLIRQAGYATAYIGKSHFGADTPRRDLVDDEAAVRARGFDDVHQVPGPLALARTDSHLSRRWQALGLLEAYREDYRRRAQDGGAAAWASPLPVEEFADSYVGARAEAWLRAYRQERPFLLVVGFGGPHPPLDPPEPYASMYDPSTIPDPIPAGEPGDWVPEYVRRRMLELTGAQNRGHAPHVAQEIARQRMASYGGKISLIDDRVGRILAVLDERGWTEDTLVIFLADHGEMGGDHGRYNKSVFFESAARIPLVMRWPAALPPGGRVEALVEQLDLFATVVEAAGAPPSRRAFARSLLPLARGDAGAGQRGPRPSRASWG
ncbi:MAG TPA: sulfatase-like hydrolase/transferase, partial [Chloroflexota bacterium]|nr:sulfatase-like hydrolase/transferase [Chloroflexota bacterium]